MDGCCVLSSKAVANLHQTKVGDGDLVEDVGNACSPWTPGLACSLGMHCGLSPMAQQVLDRSYLSISVLNILLKDSQRLSARTQDGSFQVSIFIDQLALSRRPLEVDSTKTRLFVFDLTLAFSKDCITDNCLISGNLKFVSDSSSHCAFNLRFIFLRCKSCLTTLIRQKLCN